MKNNKNKIIFLTLLILIFTSLSIKTFNFNIVKGDGDGLYHEKISSRSNKLSECANRNGYIVCKKNGEWIIVNPPSDTPTKRNKSRKKTPSNSLNPTTRTIVLPTINKHICPNIKKPTDCSTEVYAVGIDSHGCILKYACKQDLSFFDKTPIAETTYVNDECDKNGYIWTHDFGIKGKWNSYGRTPSDPIVENSNIEAELFCSDKENHDYWPRKMWHNGAVKLKLECENDPDGISGCGILCKEDGNVIPETIIVEQNGEYKLCTSDKAGNAVVQKVYVNWIDWGGDKNGPNSGRPEIIRQDGDKKLLCKLDDGSIYDGRWLNAKDGDVTCNVLVKDNDAHGSNPPEIVSVIPEESVSVKDDSKQKNTQNNFPNQYLSNWYNVGTPGFSGVKRIEFIGNVFNFLFDTDLDRDLLTPELVSEGFNFIFAEDVEKTADPTNTAALRVTDYAGNHNDANDQDLSDWVIRIDKTPPVFDEGLKCYSKPKGSSLQSYLGNEPITHRFFPNGWTNSSVECTYCLIDPKTNNSSSRLESWKSKTSARKSGIWEDWIVEASDQDEAEQHCESFIFTQEQIQNYDLDGEMMDTAGNNVEFEEEFIVKIDTKPLEFDEGIRMKNTEEFRFLSADFKNATQFEAHEQFQLSLGIADPQENEAPIDWVNSWISLRHYPGIGATEGIERLSNTTFNNLPSGVEIDMDSQLITFTNNSDIFEKAGLYEINFYLIDQAHNEQPQKIQSRYVKIVPSEIDSQGEDSNSTFEDITGEGDIYANNNDKRTLNIILRDRFNNVIYKRDIKVKIIDQDMSNSTYDLTQQGGVNGFAEGLSFDLNISDGNITSDSITQTWNYNTEEFAENTFEVKSYLPSVKVVYGFDGASMLVEETDGLGNVIGQVAEFQFTAPSINPDGTINSTQEDIVIFEKSLHFKPIVYGYMVNKLDTDSSSIRFIDVLTRMIGQKIELQFGQEFPFFVYTNTGGSDGYLLSKTLPNKYDVLVKAHMLSGIGFHDEDYGKDVSEEERTINFCPTSEYCSQSEGSELTQTTPLPSGGAIGAPKFAFSSKIKTRVERKSVIYPGGNLGNDLGNGNYLFDDSLFDGDKPAWFNDAKIEIIRIEADIEGDILGTKDDYFYTEESGSGKSNILEMGGVSAQDIREDITRNAYGLIRGIEAESPTNSDLENGWTFTENNNVLYFKGDGQNSATNIVKLGGSFTGKGTIIVEDANILIDKDMYYWTGDELEDSLGIILINSKIHKSQPPLNLGPDIGNIYITPDVKHIVGTYFAEGSILTAIYSGEGTIPNPDRSIITGVANRTLNLPMQLLIEGTILTKNTLGGVIDELTGLGQNKTPWGIVPNTDEGLNAALKYDLHWLRRYSPKVPVYDQKLTCVTSQSGGCDKNKHATVIRPDGKVKNLTPPGFNITTLINR